jgi:putative transposase
MSMRTGVAASSVSSSPKNAIESLNYQLRKIIKNRGHFPNDDAAIKLLWLAIRDIEDERARARAKEKGLPANLGALALAYPDRINLYLT